MRLTSIRPLAEAMFFKRATNVKNENNISKKLLWKIFVVSSIINPNYKGRDQKRYAKLTSINFYKLIYGHDYDFKKTNHKKRLKKLENHLDILVQPYNSIHQSNIHLFNKMEENGTEYYQYNGRSGIKWSKLSYSLPPFIEIPFDQKNIKLCDWDFIPMILLSLFAIASERICFTYKQLEIMFGMSKYDAKKAAKKLGIQIRTYSDRASWFEKNGYELHKQFLTKTKNSIIRGNQIHDVKICKKFLNDHNVKIDWWMMFYLRMFIYTNKNFITPEYFTEFNSSVDDKLQSFFGENGLSKVFKNTYHDLNSSNFTENHFYETFPENLKSDMINSCINNKREIYKTKKDFVNQKTSHFQNIYATGIQETKTNKYIKEQKKEKNKIKRECVEKTLEYIDNDNLKYSNHKSHDSVTLDRLAQSEIVLDICNSATFGEFTEKTQKLYKSMMEKHQTVYCWKDMKRSILKRLSILPQTENVKLFSRKLLEILGTDQAFRSPIFREDFNRYIFLDSDLVFKYVDIIESEFDKKREMNPILFTTRKLKLKETCLKDENVDFEKEKQKIFKYEKMSNHQKQMLKQLKEEIEGIRTTKRILEEAKRDRERRKTNIKDFMKETLRKKEFLSREELIRFIRINQYEPITGIKDLEDEICCKMDNKILISILDDFDVSTDLEKENYELLDEIVCEIESKKEVAEEIYDLTKFKTRSKENKFVTSLKKGLGNIR